MAVSGIQSCNMCDPQHMLRNFQAVKSKFDQLGQDLKSGNLSQAQADFATLSQNLPGGPQNTNDEGATDFNTLAQALQSGNLSQAQQAYASVQQGKTCSLGTSPPHRKLLLPCKKTCSSTPITINLPPLRKPRRMPAASACLLKRQSASRT